MNIRTFKFTVSMAIILVAVCIVYFTPKAKHQSSRKEVLSVMGSIPDAFGRWRGRNIDVEIDREQPVYNFLSKALSKFYYDLYLPDKGVFFVLLDAGNFHYPKICMMGGGMKTTDLPQRTIDVQGNKIPLYLILAEGEQSTSLITYWICIDKHLVTRWSEQKIRQLFYTMFNKKSTGFMIRADIICPDGDIDKGVQYVEKFFNDMYKDLPDETREYLFGNTKNKV